jgi:hypothetical protein
MAQAFVSPNPLSSHHIYFSRLSNWFKAPISVPAPDLCRIRRVTPSSNAKGGVVLQSEISTPPDSLMSNEPVEFLRSRASGMPDTSHTRREVGQNVVSVIERPLERPMVPTSASDWETKKQIIRELYLEQNMILNEVIDIMITKYKFKAT